jgi:chromosome segregation ATPase
MEFEGRNHPKYLNKYGRSWIKEWSDAIQIFCFYNYLSEQLYSAQKYILDIQERILETVKQIATDNTNITDDVEQIVSNKLDNEMNDINNRLSNTESSLLSNKKQIDVAIENSISLSDEKLTSRLGEAIESIQTSYDKEFKNVQAQLNETENSNEKLDTKIDTVTNTIANQIADVQNQLNESNNSIGNMDNKINNVVDTKIDTVTNQFINELEDIQDEINQSKGSITKIDNEINKVVNNEINDVTNIFEKKIDEVQTESIETSKKLEDDLKTYFQDITKSIEDNLLNNEKEDRQRFDELTNQINQINETLKKNEDNMEKKITTTTSGVEENETNISALNEQFKTLSESITSSQKNAPQWFDTYKNIIERNSGNISGIEKNETNISALSTQFETLSESIQSSQDNLTGFMSAFDDDTLKILAQASDISDRLDVLQKKYEESEIVKVDPTVLTKYNNFERELRTFADQLDSQQEQINKTLLPYVSHNWDNINKHVDDSLKPYIDNYINKKFIEEIKDSIRSL